jgi:hypothetical protein
MVKLSFINAFLLFATTFADPDRNVVEEKQNWGDQAKNWIINNPLKAVAFGAAGAVVAAPVIVAAPALGALGFGAAGPVAGMCFTTPLKISAWLWQVGGLAAAVQGPAVTVGSLFSILQGAGMGGAAAPAIHGVFQVAAVAGIGAGAVKEVLDGAKKDEKPGKKSRW